MLSIVPFDHRLSAAAASSAKDPDRPFKSYHRPPVTLPTSGYYSPYQQSYMASSGYDRRGTDAMELRPPPAHIYQQGGHHHMLDMSVHSSSAAPPPLPRDVKQEHENMYGLGAAAMSHLHQGYGSHELRSELHAAHSPSLATMHQALSIAGGAPSGGGGGGVMMARSASSLSPVTSAPAPNNNNNNNNTTATSASPDSHDQAGQTSDSTSDSSASSQKHILPKKRTHGVPNEMKDSSYWDKRKKNNESAKRSREARRMKEEQIAMRVVYLEQENLQLRTEVSLLKTEIEKLRCMLYNS